MSLCDTCRAPGSCCSFFYVSAPRTLADEIIAAQGLPFVPVAPVIGPGTGCFNDASTGYWRYSCTKLGADGRCTIYAGRPHACSHYVPGIDPLCAEHVPLLKGIPVITMRGPIA